MMPAIWVLLLATRVPGMRSGVRADGNDECCFVAIRKFNAVQAIGPNFMRKFLFVDFPESEFLEKILLIGKHENALYLEGSRFF